MRVATETYEKRRSFITDNMKSIPKQARPDLQVDGGDVNPVNVNNRIETLKLKNVRCSARRRTDA